VRAGGKVNRTIVVGDEFFDPELQLLLLRTGMRQAILGIAPFIAHYSDIARTSKRMGIDCVMLTIVNNRVVYFPRFKPVPCMIRTTNKRFIDRALETYRDLSQGLQPFEEWLKHRSLADLIQHILPEVEAECRLIEEYASAWSKRLPT
jgi:hypothetical protein